MSAVSPQQIARSLQSMLDYCEEPSEFEETYMATFQVSYSDMFGHLHTYNLCEDGDSIPVTTENRQVHTLCATVYHSHTHTGVCGPIQ